MITVEGKGKFSPLYDPFRFPFLHSAYRGRLRPFLAPLAKDGQPFEVDDESHMPCLMRGKEGTM
jgi:hypothetical protein